MELVTSTDLATWSERRDSEAHLPTLVRRLILASSTPTHIRVPADEGVQLRGFDGQVESEDATAWVPAGASVWEIGKGADPARKAADDYDKRLEQTSADERARISYVFVTSRVWPGGRAWASAKDDGWAGVSVLDAHDLVTWMHVCPGVTAWFAQDMLGRPTLGIAALRDWYTRWRSVTDPLIPSDLVLAGRRPEAEKLVTDLMGPARELAIVSQSREESLAFIAASLTSAAAASSAEPTADGGEAPADTAEETRSLSEAILERCLVVTDPSAWGRWAVHEQELVLLAAIDHPPIDLALEHGHHVVVALGAGPGRQATLPRLSRMDAVRSWESVGLDFATAEEIGRASRRSLTSLRRRLGRSQRLRRPHWAEGAEANLLAPLLLVGQWRDDTPADRAVVEELTGRQWRSVARDLAQLRTGEDAPVMERTHRWEFLDVVDAWDALNHNLVADDLEIFDRTATQVLTDPGAATPEFDAPFREGDGQAIQADAGFSSALRRGLATTLVALGTVGADQPLQGGTTGRDHATRGVAAVLNHADVERWRSLSKFLPTLAEAAPGSFLAAVESSLNAHDAPVLRMLDSQPARPGLIWALELIAFFPEHTARVAEILARLVEHTPDDSGGGQPAASLSAMLHPYIPQGAVDQRSRIAILDRLRSTAPSAAWRLMLGMVNRGGSGVILVRGPRYAEVARPPQTTTYADLAQTYNQLGERIAHDAGTRSERWIEAVGVLDSIPDSGRAVMLTSLEAVWAQLGDEAQARILEIVEERLDRHERFSHARWALDKDALRPIQDFVHRHADPLDEHHDAKLFGWAVRRADLDETTEEGQAALAAARSNAILRALERGLDGVRRLAELAQAPQLVGSVLGQVSNELDDAVISLLDEDGADHALARGLALSRLTQDFTWLTDALQRHPGLSVHLLTVAPADEALLQLVESQGAPVQQRFWAAVEPWNVAPNCASRAIGELLDHDRPYSAIDLLSLRRGADEDRSALIVRALTAARRTAEPQQAVTSLTYAVGELFDELEAEGVDEQTLAELEWIWLVALDDNRPPRALHQRLATEPEFYAEVLSVVYRSDDVSESPQDEPVEPVGAGEGREPDDQPLAIVQAAWTLLHEWWTPLPGTARGGEPTAGQVQEWVTKARSALAASGRTAIASVAIGEALSGPAFDPDGTWPCRAVRDVIEAEQDPRLESGLSVGRYNQRGITVRDAFEGGDQERQLAGQYRSWAEQVRDGWPRSSALLEQLARGYDDEARRNDSVAERDGDR
jgi:hypothetical protein